MNRLNYCLIILLLASCDSESTLPNDATDSTTIIVDTATGDYQQQINSNYQVYSLPIPDSLDFAGEAVPLDRTDVRESLDRELHVNTYWHSQTFLFFKRANRWFPVIEKILEENGVPQDFKYLCLIESGLDNVVSPAGASGFWQFMSSTGKEYGLEINGNVDERYHVTKATEAACEYLKRAYDKLGSWTLAAASYNMGKTGVQNSLFDQYVESYYDLHLNSETARYVYRILAAKQILTHPNDYGFHFRAEELYATFRTTTVQVDTSITDLSAFAKTQGTTYKIIKMLNPWLRQSTLNNSTGKTYEIMLPATNFDEPATEMISEYGDAE